MTERIINHNYEMQNEKQFIIMPNDICGVARSFFRKPVEILNLVKKSIVLSVMKLLKLLWGTILGNIGGLAFSSHSFI